MKIYCCVYFYWLYRLMIIFHISVPTTKIHLKNYFLFFFLQICIPCHPRIHRSASGQTPRLGRLCDRTGGRRRRTAIQDHDEERNAAAWGEGRLCAGIRFAYGNRTAEHRLLGLIVPKGVTCDMIITLVIFGLDFFRGLNHDG